VLKLRIRANNNFFFVLFVSFVATKKPKKLVIFPLLQPMKEKDTREGVIKNILINGII
jgi:hypothetical protein